MEFGDGELVTTPRRTQRDRHQRRPARGPSAAGTLGPRATARLLGVIANLPQGALVLPGLDGALEEKSWHELDAGHPQYGLKQLLDSIGTTRNAVRDWHGPCPNSARENLLRESLRPAPTTDAWRALADAGGGDIADGLNGLTLVTAPDPAQEALIIALALRETLEQEGRTAALVTPDRMLARRVAGELGRWEIAVDDSAGRPLAHTSAGAFLCLLAEAAGAGFAPVPLLALLKHPFATLGEDAAAFRHQARALDRLVLRGARPDPGLASIAQAIAHTAAETHDKETARSCVELAMWWTLVSAALSPLEPEARPAVKILLAVGSLFSAVTMLLAVVEPAAT